MSGPDASQAAAVAARPTQAPWVQAFLYAGILVRMHWLLVSVMQWARAQHIQSRPLAVICFDADCSSLVGTYCTVYASEASIFNGE